MTTRLICGLQFRLVATLEPDRDVRGAVVEYDPRRPDGSPLSDAPFCRFSFPTGIYRGGVYAVFLDGIPVYVGQTNDLSRRFGPGEYGHIVVPGPPDLQVTNRRVNRGILEAAKKRQAVTVWFYETSERQEVEATLIDRLDLAWNRKAPPETKGTAGASAAVGSRDRWPAALKGADAAKQLILKNLAAGDEAFRAVLGQFPNDGIVYLRRAEAYEALGLLSAAAEDYRRAEALVPFAGRKAEARNGLARVQNRSRGLR